MTLRGRDDELKRLLALANRPRGRYAVICGPDGVGKTALAEEFAARIDFNEMWIPWQDKESLAFHLMDALGVLREDSATLWKTLARWKPWLLVVEDVDRPADVSAMVDRLAEHRHFGRTGRLVVATSWEDDERLWGPRAEILKLSPLSLDDAAGVLLDTAPDCGDRISAKALVTRLPNNTMLLRVTGWAITESGQRFDDWAVQSPGGVELSLNQLVEEGLPLAGYILRMLALTAEAPLPRDVINADLLGPVYGEVTAEDVEHALAGLYRYRLVSTAELPIPCLVVHTSVRAYVDDPPDVVRYRELLDEALLAAAEGAADAGRAGWARGDLLAPHLVPIAKRDSASWDTLDRLALAMSVGGRASQVMLRRAVLDADHTYRSLRQHNLGMALSDLGDHQGAVEMLRLALAGFEHDGADTVGTRHCLGQALDRIGNHGEAAKLLTQVLTEHERTLGTDHPHTLAACVNLGVANYNLYRYAEAAELHRRAHAGFEDFYGPDHPETLTSRSNLGVALFATGDRHKAAEILQQNLAARERVLGPDHPDTRNSRYWLTTAMMEIERPNGDE